MTAILGDIPFGKHWGVWLGMSSQVLYVRVVSKMCFGGLDETLNRSEVFQMTSYCKKSIWGRISIDDWKLFLGFTDKKELELYHTRFFFHWIVKKCIMLHCKKVIVLSRTKESVIFSKNAIKIWYIKYIKYTRNNILFRITNQSDDT